MGAGRVLEGLSGDVFSVSPGITKEVLKKNVACGCGVVAAGKQIRPLDTSNHSEAI